MNKSTDTPRIFEYIAELVDGGHLAAIRTTKGLKAMLSLIRHADNNTLESYPSVDTIAREIGEANVNRARKGIRELRNAGLVTAKATRGRKSNTYRLEIPTRTHSVPDENSPGRNRSRTESTPSTRTDSVPSTRTDSVPQTPHRTPQGTPQSICAEPQAASAPTPTPAPVASPVDLPAEAHPAAHHSPPESTPRPQDESPPVPKRRTRQRSSGEDSGAPLLSFPVKANRGQPWQLTQDHIKPLRDAFPGIDIVAECRKALAWCIANPAKQKTPKGMPSFLNRWIGRANDSGKATPLQAGQDDEPYRMSDDELRKTLRDMFGKSEAEIEQAVAERRAEEQRHAELAAQGKRVRTIYDKAGAKTGEVIEDIANPTAEDIVNLLTEAQK